VGLYKRWCEATKEKDKRKGYWTYVEKDGGRDEIRDDLAETIRSHYDRLERIAEDWSGLDTRSPPRSLVRGCPRRPKAAPAISARFSRPNWQFLPASDLRPCTPTNSFSASSIVTKAQRSSRCGGFASLLRTRRLHLPIFWRP